MKTGLIIVLAFIACTSKAQDKHNYVAFNKITELNGTPYVLASIENRGKMFNVLSKYLLFINTSNGETTQMDFPKDAWLERFEQVRIDSLGINKVVLSANTVNLDGNKGIDWNDPKQIIILSVDGKEKIQITDDRFFVSTWSVSRHTGVIVITGYVDSNSNGKYDKTDKNEILLYDLGKMKLVAKI